MSSKRYVKRIWRVPKDRGASAFLATQTCKMLIKHGWPVKSLPSAVSDGFQLLHHDTGYDLPDDLREAIAIAVRVIARTYRVDLSEHSGSVVLNAAYRVHPGGYLIRETP